MLLDIFNTNFLRRDTRKDRDHKKLGGEGGKEGAYKPKAATSPLELCL